MVLLLTLIMLVLSCDRPRMSAVADKKDVAEQERLLAELSALGYAGFVIEEMNEKRIGVVKADTTRTLRGVTIFGTRTGIPNGYFFDHEGKELGRLIPRPENGSSLLWMEPASDGNLVILGRGYLIKTNWSGETIWEAPKRVYHHGFTQRLDGTIVAMAQKHRVVQYDNREISMLDDEILEISSSGEILRSFSILDLLGPEMIPEPLLQRSADSSDFAPGTGRDPVLEGTLAVDNNFDVFHLNSVEIIPRDIGVANAGDLLICLRTLNLILIVSLDPYEIVWLWDEGRTTLDRPHAPHLLDNGNILIFDNGWKRGYSRLVELDPRQEVIVWQYVANPPKSFYTRRGGMVQVLPNGNLLVTQSDAGRVFEITREGEIVWDFWNPVLDFTKDEKTPKRKNIYRAWRWFRNDIPDLDTPLPRLCTEILSSCTQRESGFKDQ